MSKRKKSNEIKPAKVAEVVDQESQVTKVQEVTDAQQSQTPIQPDTVLVDPEVKEPPVEKGAVKEEGSNKMDDGSEIETEVEEKEVEEDKPVDYNSADVLNQGREEVPFDTEKEAKLAQGDVESREPTRYGNGKEKPLDSIENPYSRNFPPSPAGNVTGTKNEYPR